MGSWGILSSVPFFDNGRVLNLPSLPCALRVQIGDEGEVVTGSRVLCKMKCGNGKEKERGRKEDKKRMVLIHRS